MSTQNIPEYRLDKDQSDMVRRTLEHYRSRTEVTDDSPPDGFYHIEQKMKAVKDSGMRLLVNFKDSYMTTSVVLELFHVGEYFATGHTHNYVEGEKVYIPYTIQYYDIYCKNERVEIIKEGDNPFGTEKSGL